MTAPLSSRCCKKAFSDCPAEDAQKPLTSAAQSAWTGHCAGSAACSRGVRTSGPATPPQSNAPCIDPCSGKQLGQCQTRLGRAHEASPTRKACTPAARILVTSSRPRMPDSVTSRRSAGTSGSMSSVVCSVTSKVRRLRLLMPTSGVLSLSARCSSARSCTSTSTAMFMLRAIASRSAICASSRQAAISRMASAPMARAS
ncbi:hypothetical protein Y695_02116 [Hydrogenophaga sp. T4]|nr:hypothetical protein Y695_02116 [Hydrogenophaga sp. T4]